MTEELKPCPFCGSADIMEGVFYAEGSVEKRGAVRCADCGARAPEVAWRKLADVPAQRSDAKLREALKNMLGAYDTPVSRRRYPPDEFMQEAIKSARDALAEPLAEGVPSEVAAKVRKHVEFLAHNATGLSMCEWDKISNDLLAAADHLDRRSPAGKADHE